MDVIGEAVTDAQIDEMLKATDIDHDGKINYEGMLTILLLGSLFKVWHFLSLGADLKWNFFAGLFNILPVDFVLYFVKWEKGAISGCNCIEKTKY